jgi:peptidoglycan-N-acetylglucosamine deacetylase
MGTTKTGSIILEHDGGGDRSETVAALKIAIPRLIDEGYQFTVP